MWHVLQLAFRLALAVAGAFCLLTACLAYPGEEGKMQSVLEDLWAKIDDRQKGALSAHTVFMQQVAKATSRGFDAVFGHALLSRRCLGVSVAYSIASFGTLAFLDNFANVIADKGPLRDSWKGDASNALAGLSLAAVYLFVGSIPLIYKKFRFTKVWLFLILISVPFLWEAMQDDPVWAPANLLLDFVPWGLMATVGAFGCDVLFIAATRRSLRWAGEMQKTFKIAAVILLNVLFGIGLMVAPLIYSFAYVVLDEAWGLSRPTSVKYKLASVVFAVAGSNTLDFLASIVFVVLAVVLLIHRALWPVLNRSVFRLQEIGANGRRAILISLGAGLLGAALGAHAPAWARKAAELLKG